MEVGEGGKGGEGGRDELGPERWQQRGSGWDLNCIIMP